MSRKIPFDNVIRNLKLGRYRRKICSVDYANEGIQPFDERKFAEQLGTSTYKLREIGLVRITEQCGWHLPREPTVEELIAYKMKIEKLNKL